LLSNSTDQADDVFNYEEVIIIFQIDMKSNITISLLKNEHKYHPHGNEKHINNENQIFDSHCFQLHCIDTFDANQINNGIEPKEITSARDDKFANDVDDEIKNKEKDGFIKNEGSEEENDDQLSISEKYGTRLLFKKDNVKKATHPIF